MCFFVGKQKGIKSKFIFLMNKEVTEMKEYFAVVSAVLMLVFASAGVLAYTSYLETPLKSISPVQQFSDDSEVIGAWSILNRDYNKVVTNLHTKWLEPGTAVTLWWVIFNDPSKCTHPEGGFRCGKEDLPEFGGDNSAKTSIVYADGKVIRDSAGHDGLGNFDARLETWDKSGVLSGEGLTNPLGADVHLVLKSHGRLIQGMTYEMTHTFDGGCDVNTCEDIQYAVHEALACNGD